ncbi:MAG: rhodanese-like domain-containing protein [Beggiatoa sp.]|nr:rhodanese-like domain-containing protein [Beggiatoa sp.]
MAMTAQDLVQEARKHIREIDPDTAEQHLGEPRTVVIDVREPAELEAGRLPGAIHIPRGLLEFRIGSCRELMDPSVPVLVYCRSGARSALAAETLQRMGYSNVSSITGGFEAWVASGKPLDA